jgi:hypothetical protein
LQGDEDIADIALEIIGDPENGGISILFRPS